MARIGYAYGTVTRDGEWLTILGSARDRVVLGDTPETAYNPYPDVTFTDGSTLELRRVEAVYAPGVTVTQTAYRVLPDTPTA